MCQPFSFKAVGLRTAVRGCLLHAAARPAEFRVPATTGRWASAQMGSGTVN